MSRKLACAPKTAGSAAVARREARQLAGFRPGGFRAQEVLALHRSPEVRQARRKLAQLGQTEAGAIGQEQAAEHRKHAALTDANRRAAQADQAEAAAIRHDASDAQPRRSAAYRKLVELHGDGAERPLSSIGS